MRKITLAILLTSSFLMANENGTYQIKNTLTMKLQKFYLIK